MANISKLLRDGDVVRHKLSIGLQRAKKAILQALGGKEKESGQIVTVVGEGDMFTRFSDLPLELRNMIWYSTFLCLNVSRQSGHIQSALGLAMADPSVL